MTVSDCSVSPMPPPKTPRTGRLFHMKPILVQLDDYTAKLLEQVAPGRGRKRSKFIRQAVIKALMDVMEEHTRRAYERQPGR